MKKQIILLTLLSAYQPVFASEYKIIIGLIPPELIGGGVGDEQSSAMDIEGPTNIYPYESYQYTITNYNEDYNYLVNSSAGEATLENSTIDFSVNSTEETTISLNVENDNDENTSLSLQVNNIDDQEVVGIKGMNNQISGYNVEGMKVWSKEYNKLGYSIGFHNDFFYTFINDDLHRINIDNGEIDWVNNDISSPTSRHLEVDHEGNVYTIETGRTGRSGHPSKIYKISANGQKEWEFSAPAEITDRMSLQSNGDLYLTGRYDDWQYYDNIDDTEFNKSHLYIRSLNTTTGGSNFHYDTREDIPNVHFIEVSDSGDLYMGYAVNDYTFWKFPSTENVVDKLGAVNKDVSKGFDSVAHDSEEGYTYVTTHNDNQGDYILKLDDRANEAFSFEIPVTNLYIDEIKSNYIYLSRSGRDFGRFANRRLSKDGEQYHILNKDIDNINVALHRGLENYSFSWSEIQKND